MKFGHGQPIEINGIKYFCLILQDKDGIFYLGICYENGWGVPENQCKAADLYRQAAKEGHCTAQYNLAAFFEHGMGGKPNF